MFCFATHDYTRVNKELVDFSCQFSATWVLACFHEFTKEFMDFTHELPHGVSFGIEKRN